MPLSDFIGTKQRVANHNIATILFGIVTTYAVALFASALLLWFFGRFDNTAPIIGIQATITLALPAVLGASAGRLLLQ